MSPDFDDCSGDLLGSSDSGLMLSARKRGAQLFIHLCIRMHSLKLMCSPILSHWSSSCIAVEKWSNLLPSIHSDTFWLFLAMLELWAPLRSNREEVLHKSLYWVNEHINFYKVMNMNWLVTSSSPHCHSEPFSGPFERPMWIVYRNSIYGFGGNYWTCFHRA